MLLRIVNCELTKGVSIHEHFMGFLLADDTTGQGLLQLFLGHLEKLGLDLSNCRGQSYDNGSNMQGKTQGVQARMLQLNPKALCVQCGSHTLNLVVGDAAKSSTISLGYFGTLQRLYNLFSGSVQRWTILQEHVKDFSVKALSTTRWECRVDAVKAVRYQLPEIVDALTAVHKHATLKKDPECASTADSLKDNMMKWSFMVSTFVWYNVLYHINRVSKILQSPSVSIETVRREVMAVADYLEEYRECGFNSAQVDAREVAEKMEVEMSWPVVRQRKRKRQFDYEGRDEDMSTPEELFKREFFLHLVDTARTTLRERFSNMEVFFDLYGFLYSSKSLRGTIQTGKLDGCCRKLEEVIGDVDGEDLKMELKGAVQSFPPHITTPLQMLDHIYKENVLDIYPNVSIALQHLLTLPVTVASGERSFSTLKRLKTYMRSTMAQDRLSALATISIEHEVQQSLDMDEVISRFAEAKVRKVRFV